MQIISKFSGSAWLKPSSCIRACVLAMLLLASFSKASSIESQTFESDEQRALFYRLTQELRCPKCQNQNISDSNSEIAVDLRRQVARLVKENQSENQIKKYMVNRYGDFVLYEPPLTAGTLLLWFGPLVMALLGVLVFFLSVIKRKQNEASESRSDEVGSEEIN